MEGRYHGHGYERDILHHWRTVNKWESHAHSMELYSNQHELNTIAVNSKLISASSCIEYL